MTKSVFRCFFFSLSQKRVDCGFDKRLGCDKGKEQDFQWVGHTVRKNEYNLRGSGKPRTGLRLGNINTKLNRNTVLSFQGNVFCFECLVRCFHAEAIRFAVTTSFRFYRGKYKKKLKRWWRQCNLKCDDVNIISFVFKMLTLEKVFRNCRENDKGTQIMDQWIHAKSVLFAGFDESTWILGQSLFHVVETLQLKNPKSTAGRAEVGNSTMTEMKK